MAFAFKELQKLFANLVPRHLSLNSRCNLIFRLWQSPLIAAIAGVSRMQGIPAASF
jgi:hypothetical protein